MPGYETRQEHVAIGGHDYRLRVLADRQQFWDPDGHGERLGISSAQWALFGQLWPAGELLARAMQDFDIRGKRILELGCGIGLASLVLQRRGADVVASDMHPLAEVFLAYNAALNELPALHYRHLNWDEPLPELGRFDLIIASDVLYESGHAALLGGVVDRHAQPEAEVLVADPGRGNSAHLNRQMGGRGFELEERRCALHPDEAPPFRGRLLHYTRGGHA
ncbi:class I SAM-dependent methyltransferase [Pseudoxanthomonas suwonensis]|jgi:Predicted methyltransferase|uniref:class I SAM-dependent methyltransferase n=1 Tax=Pseudoxanthomonas suwonensis TaxID=314722 RepID=UPI00138F9B87|nr:methyltransferase domain-containing protein [Pseudoxanthomonas suwonensis]KAF1700463.1 SAM-dependent methyltransferase [Pseudoxanthomonas suwonensis]